MTALPPTAVGAGEDAGDDDMQDVAFARRGCNCFWMPCFRRSETSALWERMRSPPQEIRERQWWWLGWKKVREWSEIVAGPKWKTFIRRFNYGGGRTRAVHFSKHGSFQYDPLSYALNFDDGVNAGKDGDGGGSGFSFSARFASVPVTAKSSMDLGKDGPAFT